MKVFLLGGYGAVGTTTAQIFAGSDLVSEIAIAGRSLERAESTARALGAKGKAVQVDAADESHLASAMEGYDVIAHAATFEVSIPALRAAIRSGVPYCDAMGGFDFFAQLEKLTDAAKGAGIAAISCNGVSPCLTNLMGVHAARQLDDLEQLQGGRSWVFAGARNLTPQQWVAEPDASWSVLQQYKGFFTWILQTIGEAGNRPVRVFRQGRWVDTDPLVSGIGTPKPEGGMATEHPYLSCDPLFDTLPRIPAVAPPVTAWFAPFPPHLSQLLREQACQVVAGAMDAPTAVDTIFDEVEADPGYWLSMAKGALDQLSPDWVSAIGRKDGRAARVNCWLVPELWSDEAAWLLTSIPLAVTAFKLLRGEVPGPGVMMAESAFEPLPYLDEVASLVPTPLPGGKMTGESFDWLE